MICPSSLNPLYGSGYSSLAAALGASLILLVTGCQSGSPTAASEGGATPAATDGPVTNSLGMTLVPVPGTAVLFSTWEVRRQDYDAFVKATGHPWPIVDKISFRQVETPTHPAVNVSWNDATAFCQWLSRKEGVKYRLPTDREWSVAAGLGAYEAAGRRPAQLDRLVIDTFPHPQGMKGGNYRDKSWYDNYRLYEASADSVWLPHTDGFIFTAPVGSFSPDANGLYDLGGNVWEWCADKYDTGGNRVLRGGSWEEGTLAGIFASVRWHKPPFHRDRQIGFRVVREIEK